MALEFSVQFTYFFKFKKKLFIFSYVYSYVPVYMCAGVLEDHRARMDGVTDSGGAAQHECWELNSGPSIRAVYYFNYQAVSLALKLYLCTPSSRPTAPRTQ